MGGPELPDVDGPIPGHAPSHTHGPDVDEHRAQDGDDGDNGDAIVAKKPGRLRKLIEKLGLDLPTVLTMFKGSLPPTIGIAMYQAPAVSSYFVTLGYLIPIITVLALAILPRGKFMMNLVLCTLAVCVGSALSMLALWSGVQARLNTTPKQDYSRPAETLAYNSSQSAVCALWLFFSIWLGNTVRAKLPSFNLPIIIGSILINISATYGPLMRTTAAAEAFVRQLFTAMLTALAIALGVNVLIFPASSRLVVFKEFAGAIGLLKKTVSLQKKYLVRLESDDMFAVATRTSTMSGLQDGETSSPHCRTNLTKEAKAAKALREATDKTAEVAGKLYADMTFAKRDIAWGKLDAKDLSDLFTLFRNVYIPVMGMTTIIDIFKRVSERRGWDVPDDASEDRNDEKEREKHVWNEVMKQMHEPFSILSEAIDHGLEHAGLCLELLPRPKAAEKKAARAGNVDVEAQVEAPKPGELGFARVIEGRVQEFYSKKGELLKTWIREQTTSNEEQRQSGIEPCSEQQEREQAQLYVVLYMENLMHSSGRAVHDLAVFAENKLADGTMSKNRLIVPTFRRLRKWFWATLRNEDSSAEQTPDMMEGRPNIVYFGDGYNKKKDPEHLPPATAWQRFGTRLCKVWAIFGSEESAFGFRAACATMTVGIVAFLEKTQRFFMEQRLVWAMIIIAIGMNMTSGQSFFGFMCRVGGTVLAMCFSLIIWYIVDARLVGAIVFLWFSVFLNYYFFLKFPRFLPAILIAIVTQVLIIGYELQVLTIGREIAERTGQPFYPTYLLAPYRLACVAGGSLVAFFWTIFPKPLTDRTWLRRDLSATLYLMANYFGVINSTLHASLRDEAGDRSTPHTPAHQLFKVGRKIFGKVMMIIPSMAQHSDWQRFEPTIGGNFPRAAYDDIIVRSTRIMGYLTMVSYTLTHPTRTKPGRSIDKKQSLQDEPQPLDASDAATRTEDQVWAKALADVLDNLKPTHHAILSTLTVLSNSLLSGQSLPHFVPLPRPYELTRRFMWLRQHRHKDKVPVKLVPPQKGQQGSSSSSSSSSSSTKSSAEAAPVSGLGEATHLLDPKHMEQPGYAEFAVLQVCTTLICDDLEGLVKAVSGLVGVVDFSFRVGGSDSSLGSTGNGKGKVE